MLLFRGLIFKLKIAKKNNLQYELNNIKYINVLKITLKNKRFSKMKHQFDTYNFNKILSASFPITTVHIT